MCYIVTFLLEASYEGSVVSYPRRRIWPQRLYSHDYRGQCKRVRSGPGAWQLAAVALSSSGPRPRRFHCERLLGAAVARSPRIGCQGVREQRRANDRELCPRERRRGELLLAQLPPDDARACGKISANQR